MKAADVRIKEFEELLRHYRMSAAAQAILCQTSFVGVVGPTGSGRDTLIQHLVRMGGYYPVVTDTTRSPRMNNGQLERHGVEYYFRTEAEMLDGLRRGSYYEAAIIHRSYVSGGNIAELERALAEQKVAICDVEIQGMDTIRIAKPDAVAIFILPPSFAEWVRRLQARTPDMMVEELKRRFMSAQKEFQAALQHDFYHIVINDNLERAARHIDAIVKGVRKGEKRDSDRARSIQLIRHLSDQIAFYLEQQSSAPPPFFAS